MVPESYSTFAVTIAMSRGMSYKPNSSIKAGGGPIFKGVNVPFVPESLYVILHANKFVLYVPSVKKKIIH